MASSQDETKTSLHDFNLKASLLYLISMSTFWMLVIAAGILQPRDSGLAYALSALIIVSGVAVPQALEEPTSHLTSSSSLGHYFVALACAHHCARYFSCRVMPEKLH